MVKRIFAMHCGERSLGHLSLVFGLLAVGTLSLSITTDFWLFTTEALDPSAFIGPPPPELQEPPETTDEPADEPPDVDIEYNPFNTSIIVANVHSGLWRSCIYFDDQGTPTYRVAD